jgi:hypothetical protein
MKRKWPHLVGLIALVALVALLYLWITRGAELHVAIGGDDANPGTKGAPLRTIGRAAEVAQPGDTITVHAGVYRERVNPPRGGTSPRKRIIYRAAPGETVEIKGSEPIQGWARVTGDVWSATVPNAFFGDFNPYADLIRGDWFNPKGREHHTGAVYLNGDWLMEAATLEEVMAGKAGTAVAPAGGGGVLLNVAWTRPGLGGGDAGRIPATSYAAQSGVKNAPCSEGGECIGWLEDGDWVRYEGVDFGGGADRLEIRAASATRGGRIEIRLDAPGGELLGSCSVPNTGGWQSWSTFTAPIKTVSGAKMICLAFRGNAVPATVVAVPEAPLWFGRVDGTNTTIWAQFPGADPNQQLVEINVRQTVFYPDKPGRNFITVRGFTMRHAATPWAPPTAEQPGLIGTHWSKGWVIEGNVVSHSICTGIALGKHGDEFDNTSANSAEGYVKTIERAHAHPIAWTKENIGGHVVRDNTISHCEQAGIVGSLGCAFSAVTGNTIHDIHVRRLFTGAEMAGIKFHAAIDTEISRNHIYRTTRGLWLDWMAQGTRVTRNLFHDNITEDLFVEVNHGPFLVDNNIFLSPTTLLDMSQGGAYAHNLMAGKIISTEEPGRETPYHPAHSTTVAGLANIRGGDNRFYNNIFIGDGSPAVPAVPPKQGERHRRVTGHGTCVYDVRELPLQAGGNVYYHGARPYAKEAGSIVAEAFDPAVRLEGQSLHMALDDSVGRATTAPVTSGRLGNAKVPGTPYVNPDGSPITIDADYFGARRDRSNPTPGPFENPGQGAIRLKVR